MTCACFFYTIYLRGYYFNVALAAGITEAEIDEYIKNKEGAAAPAAAAGTSEVTKDAKKQAKADKKAAKKQAKADKKAAKKAAKQVNQTFFTTCIYCKTEGCSKLFRHTSAIVPVRHNTHVYNIILAISTTNFSKPKVITAKYKHAPHDLLCTEKKSGKESCQGGQK